MSEKPERACGENKWMLGRALSGIRDVHATCDTGGSKERVWRRTDLRKQFEGTDALGKLVVLGLIAERPAHTATTCIR